MNKKKEKEPNNEEPPIDYQVEKKNLEYTIVLKDNEISNLKEQKDKLGNIIKKLESDYYTLKKQCANNFELEKEIGKLRHSKELLLKDIDNLRKDILNQKRKFQEEKEEMEKYYNAKINQLQATINAYIQKVELANKIIDENKELNKRIEELKKEKIEIIQKNEKDLVDLEVKYKLKIYNLKKKMLENIKNTADKVTELNFKYMDTSSKLTLMQNYKLLTQLEYQSQQLDELSKKNEILGKKNFQLKEDIEIHKEVEVSLADKNKKLKNELIKEKNNNKKENEKNIKNDFDEDKNIEKIIAKKEGKNFYINFKLINFEQKIINLKKKLNQKKIEFNNLKEKYDYIENILKKYEKKYKGILNFLEDCLNKFFNDDELLNNNEIKTNIDNIKKGDFSLLNKDAQYSTLIILMKYLMPLIQQSNLNNNISNDNFKLNFQNISKNKRYKKIYIKRPKINFRSISVDNIKMVNNVELPSLPGRSVENIDSKNNFAYNNRYKPIINKINSSRSRIRSTSAGK